MTAILFVTAACFADTGLALLAIVPLMTLVHRRAGSKFNVATRNAILGAVRAGATFAVAAKSAGVHPSTMTNWLRRGEYEDSCGSDSEYARFAREFAEADANVIRRVENSVLRATDDDWRAARFILSKRAPHIYGDREGAQVIAQRVADWILDRVRTDCDQATYGKVLAAISGAVEVEGAEVLEADTEKPPRTVSEAPGSPASSTQDAAVIEAGRSDYVAAISKPSEVVEGVILEADDPTEKPPIRNFGLKEPKKRG
jgi:hypothetical protein